MTQRELNLFERRLGVVVDAGAGQPGIVGAKFEWPTWAP